MTAIGAKRTLGLSGRVGRSGQKRRFRSARPPNFADNARTRSAGVMWDRSAQPDWDPTPAIAPGTWKLAAPLKTRGQPQSLRGRMNASPRSALHRCKSKGGFRPTTAPSSKVIFQALLGQGYLEPSDAPAICSPKWSGIERRNCAPLDSARANLSHCMNSVSFSTPHDSFTKGYGSIRSRL